MAVGEMEAFGEVGVLVAAKTHEGVADRVLLERFICQRDESAFAALVERHGGMVIGICRRVLRRAHDAEDACQASFLVLARKASSVRKRDSLASWLHGVAYRVATNLRRDLARRAARESRQPDTVDDDTMADITRREEQALIDEELARLPARYRAVLVLCYLEGKTRDEAAQELGWTVGKLRRQLERGRELLCRRLTRRGLTLSAALFVTALTEGAASAAAPPALVVATIKSGLLFAAGHTAATVGISLRAVALAEAMLKSLFVAHLKMAAGVLAVAAVGASVAPLVKPLFQHPAAVSDRDWPGWRGPTGMGTTPDTEIPLTWGGNGNENVLWSVRIDRLRPFQSYSSPIVCGDRLFYTAATPALDAKQTPPKEPAEHWVSCFRTSDGEKLWETYIAPGPWQATDHFDGYAVPTPVTDGKLIYAWFGSAVMVALDFEGHVVWRKERPGPYHFGGSQSFCSSPVFYEDTILQLCDQNEGASVLIAFDKKTGDIKWEKKRDNVFSTETTPILIKVNDGSGGRWELIVAATNQLQGLNPANGESIWWCSCPGHAATPVYGGGLVVTGSGVAVDPTGHDDVSKTQIKWNANDQSRGPSSPLIAGDYVYRLNDAGVLTCRKLATGDVIYRERLPGLAPVYEASPFATGEGKIYFASWMQPSYVIQAGPTFKILATSPPLKPDTMDFYTSPAVSRGKIFFKAGHLCCIGKRDPPTDKH
jgi:RNA polymerase sigma factor (sigma-70 family)